MNIRRINFILIFILMAALATLVYSFFALQKTSKDLAVVEARRVNSYLIAYELRQSSIDLADMARSFAANPNPKYEKIFKTVAGIRDGKVAIPESYHRIYWDFVLAGDDQPRPSSGIKRSLVDRGRDAGMTEDEIAMINESYRISNALIAIEAEAFNAAKGRFKDANGNYTRVGEPDRDYALSLLYSDVFYAEKDKIMGKIDDFFVLMEKNIKEEAQEQLDLQVFFDWLFGITALLSLALIGVTVWLTVLQNRRDLEEREAAQKEAEDENEKLNNSVIGILEAVSRLSQRDLTAKAPVTEDVIGTVSDSINLLSGETARVLHGVTEIAGEVSTVSNMVKSQADQVSETAAEERNSLQQMADSLQEATGVMNQVTLFAEESNESAAQATEVTDQALETVNDTVNDMEGIRETISETEKRIKRLGDRSQEITGIVNLINTISERTHALALNASMQAAVAGEAGRGFAVVAEEVQRLAESSRNATEQIGTLVNNIQIETNETINTVNRTISRVVEGSEQAQKAGEQMRRTKDITAKLVENVRNIANASEQQKEMSSKLLDSVRLIGESTDKTAEQIATQNQGTEQLQQAARDLVESISVFKLPAAS